MEPEGIGPPPAALRYIQSKLPRESWHWTDLWGEEHARQFVVAKATQLDVVNAIHAEVTRAIRDGTTLEDFQATLEPRLRALGWWGQERRVDPVTGEEQLVQLGSRRRLQVIYWANTRTAYAAGQWERIERVAADLPFLVYEQTISQEPRPEHLTFVGLVLPVAHPFWRTHFPPNGWLCKCSVDQITAEEAERLLAQPGYSSTPPDTTPQPWVNPRTGEIKMVPPGIDPGWDSNPGLARQEALRAHLAGRLEQAAPEIRRAAVEDLVGSAAFQLLQRGAFRADRDVFFPLGIVPHGRLPALPGQPVKPNTLWFTPDTAAKQLKEHRDLQVGDYRHVQSLLERGEVIADRVGDDGKRTFVFQGPSDGRWWRLIVKEAAGEWIIVSYHRLSADEERLAKQLRSRRARGEILRGAEGE
jgi:hypothetical protein